MIVGKHERTLAIDGPYIHVRMPFPPPATQFGTPIFVCCVLVLCMRSDHADDEQGRQSGL